MPDSQPLEARAARSGVSDVSEAPEPLVAPVRRPGRPRGRQNNATLDARAFYKPKAKKLANKKIKAANLILDKYLAGKKVSDAELTFAERVSTQCAHYAFGRPKETTEISGPEGGPIQSEDTTPQLGNLELARRVVSSFDLACRGSQGQGAPRSTPATPFSTPAEPRPGQGDTPAPPAQSAQSPENYLSEIPDQSPQKNYGNPDDVRRGDAVAPGRAGVTAPDGSLPPSVPAPAPTLPAESSVFSDHYGHISGPRKTLPNGADEPPPRTEPEVGERAEIGDWVVECLEPSREGLPLQYAIKNSRGGFVTMVPGWAAALEWVKRKSPAGADLSVKITKPRPSFSQSRPDERAERSTWQPEIHGSYPRRKR